jgi:uncharacterized protein
MVIGRSVEQTKLSEFYATDDAGFAAIWGRRRVGKTYLIKQTFAEKQGYFLKAMGEKGVSLSSQLDNFSKAFSAAFYPKGVSVKPASSWKEAFEVLTTTIKETCGNKKVVLFFDELPWLAGGKSGILSALDYYWNNFWVDMPTIKLIVCGSAASWMIDNIISNKGGLHNRITLKIRLEPFTLKQTHEFLLAKDHHLSEEQTLQLYFLFGGIPFYLKLLRNKLSVAQNIDELCFTTQGALFNEFNELYSSLFNNAVIYTEIVETLAKHPQGLTRARLAEKLTLSTDGGGLNRKLTALGESGFIELRKTYGPKKSEKRIILIDEYTSFYFNWIKPKESTVQAVGLLDTHWQTTCKSQKFLAWRGLSFERCCFKHLHETTKALAIKSIEAIGSWSFSSEKSSSKKGAQIDLFVDRNDDAISLCEIKHTSSPFTITKSYAQELKNKIAIFRNKSKTKKQIILCFISVNGLTENIYSKELVAWNITLKDIMR